MKFVSKCPELGTQTFGNPYYSNHCSSWFIEWYRLNGFKTSLTRPTEKELKWILANKKKIAENQVKIEAWLQSLGIHTNSFK